MQRLCLGYGSNQEEIPQFGVDSSLLRIEPFHIGVLKLRLFSFH